MTMPSAVAAVCHRCSHCSREFTRAEHLARHERTHTKETPYGCDQCSDAFSRRDLLRRHEVKVHGCAKVLRRRRKRPEQAQESPAEHSPSAAAGGTDGSSAHQASPNDSSIPQPAAVDFDPWFFSQWLDSGPGWEFGAEPSLEVTEQLQNQVTADTLAGMFTLPADIQPRLTPSSLHVPVSVPSPLVNDLSAPEPWVFITEEDRNMLVARIMASSIGDSWKPPPVVKMNQYIARFMACFHRHQPLFHEPTWAPRDSPAAVILIVCANGAQYYLESRAARRLFQAAVTLATESPHELVGVASLQAGMLIVAFAAWSGQTEDLDVALQFHARLALDIRSVWASTLPLSSSPTWTEWKDREVLKRTTYCCFTVLTLVAIAYDVTSHFRLEDIHGLPASEEQWRAADEISWIQARKSHPVNETWTTVSSVIQRLGEDDDMPTPSGTGPFGCHVVITSLCQAIMLFHKINYDQGDSYNHGRHRLARCLRRWQIMWESEPGSGSGVTPDSPSGPIPFNSTAMLRVAHIRLAVDHAPVRNYFAVRPWSVANIATSITTAQRPLARDAYTCRAALQACLALRVPVQLGFAVVARATFWAWSIQHALSYFECALLLGRWLLAIETINVAELTPEERRVLDLVHQILEASPSRPDVAATEQGPELLAGAVLRLFVRLLDTGDVTVWGLSPKMARVLEAWSMQVSM